jgi:hypothetical protein
MCVKHKYGPKLQAERTQTGSARRTAREPSSPARVQTPSSARNDPVDTSDEFCHVREIESRVRLQSCPHCAREAYRDTCDGDEPHLDRNPGPTQPQLPHRPCSRSENEVMYPVLAQQQLKCSALEASAARGLVQGREELTGPTSRNKWSQNRHESWNSVFSKRRTGWGPARPRAATNSVLGGVQHAYGPEATSALAHLRQRYCNLMTCCMMST